MSTNTPTTQLQQAPYLREQRNFPDSDVKTLAKQSDDAYIDIASKVNKRIIGTYALNFQITTGAKWFLTGQPNDQSEFRQVYIWTTLPAVIPHGIKFANVDRFVDIYGDFTDGTFWYTLPWVSVTGSTNQINIFLDSVNINITGGGGPQQPVPTRGTVVLEWISLPTTKNA
jgi:hypothetical protein